MSCAQKVDLRSKNINLGHGCPKSKILTWDQNVCPGTPNFSFGQEARNTHTLCAAPPPERQCATPSDFTYASTPRNASLSLQCSTPMFRTTEHGVCWWQTKHQPPRPGGACWPPFACSEAGGGWQEVHFRRTKRPSALPRAPPRDGGGCGGCGVRGVRGVLCVPHVALCCKS